MFSMRELYTPQEQQTVVTIGGGTGHFSLLRAVKQLPVHVCAVVSVADDGGSSGVLRDELGVLPPGDVRLCLAALSDATPTLRNLFGYRFSEGGLSGHVFGSLFLSALEKLTGSFGSAVEEAEKILAIKGEVIPVTEGDMRLLIELMSGTVLQGEHVLDTSAHVRDVGVRRISLAHPVAAYEKAVQRILSAHTIVLAPGDLFGSLLPNMLVPEIAHALRDTSAHVVYIANVTNKKGQTSGWNAHDYVKVINEYIGADRVETVVVNTAQPEATLLERYREQEGEGALVLAGGERQGAYNVVEADLLAEMAPLQQNGDVLAHTRSFIRHDTDKLARVLEELIKR
jgi:uncharacterized cofD-like protein